MELTTGNITAATRTELITKAKQRAAQWFNADPQCIKVAIAPPEDKTEHTDDTQFGDQHRHRVDTRIEFSADYTATVEHLMAEAAYGNPKCVRCLAESHNA